MGAIPRRRDGRPDVVVVLYLVVKISTVIVLTLVSSTMPLSSNGFSISQCGCLAPTRSVWAVPRGDRHRSHWHFHDKGLWRRRNSVQKSHGESETFEKNQKDCFDSMDPLNSKRDTSDPFLSFDLVIVGAGAAGLFASGAALSLFPANAKIAMIDVKPNFGGDCTNAACVPSKALRASARKYERRKSLVLGNNSESQSLNPLLAAQEHVQNTVKAVLQRDNVDGVSERNPRIVVFPATHCYFDDPHTLRLQGSNSTRLVSRKFLLTTGATPIVPLTWRKEAEQAGLVLSTYQTLLNPSKHGSDPIWKLLKSPSNTTVSRPARLLIVGGGPTACELGQSLARLLLNRQDNVAFIDLVAPSVLPNSEIRLQDSALQLLVGSGIDYHRGRLKAIRPDKTIILQDGSTLEHPYDAVLVCVGRSPSSLEDLKLDRAGVTLSRSRSSDNASSFIDGVVVNPNTLRSVSAPHIYAAGDCAVGVQPRTSTLAAWTGFHAVRNMIVPWFLRIGDTNSIHSVVPKVVYMDPELASVGVSYSDSVAKYGVENIKFLCADEEGSDRADMERIDRDTSVNFVALHCHKTSGRLLGGSFCGPAAAELANSVGMAITNRLTVSDLARSIHNYPSHGYLLFRVALALALDDVWGLSEACGPVGRVLSVVGRSIERGFNGAKSMVRLPRRRRSTKALRQWQAEGSSKALYLNEEGNIMQTKSFLAVQGNETLAALVENEAVLEYPGQAKEFLEWRKNAPELLHKDYST